jgi:hypothetical protein
MFDRPVASLFWSIIRQNAHLGGEMQAAVDGLAIYVKNHSVGHKNTTCATDNCSLLSNSIMSQISHVQVEVKVIPCAVLP